MCRIIYNDLQIKVSFEIIVMVCRITVKVFDESSTGYLERIIVSIVSFCQIELLYMIIYDYF